MNVSCHTMEGVMAHVWRSDAAYEWVMSHIEWVMSHINWVMSYIWMSHGTQGLGPGKLGDDNLAAWMSHFTQWKRSWHIYEGVMPHMNESCHTLNESCHTLNESCHTLNESCHTLNESCRAFQRVMARIAFGALPLYLTGTLSDDKLTVWSSHVTHEGFMSRIWAHKWSHVTMNESCHA